MARHVLRGHTETSARELRRVEDSRCTAGCRNPAELESQWPELWKVMADVRALLSEAHGLSADLRGLSACMGPDPSRDPPGEASVAALRQGLERVFQVPLGTFEAHQPASTWKG